MYRELLSRPLQLTLLLLWLVGLAQLAFWLAVGQPLASVAGTAALGAVLTVLLAGRLSQVTLLPVAVILGLLAVLALADRLGSAASAWPTLTALYSLLLWLAVISLLPLPLSGRIARLLELRLGGGKTSGRQPVEASVHWNSLALILLALLGGALPNAGLAMSLPAAPLITLAIGLIFLWLAGRRYRLHLHSDLFIALGAWGVLSLYARWANQTAALSLLDPWLGLLLALYGLAAWLVVYRLSSGALESAADRQTNSEWYLQPLQVATVVSTWLAVGQVTALALAGVLAAPGWVALATTAVVALLLLLPKRLPVASLQILSGVLLASLAVTWFYSTIVHRSLPFGLWPGGSAAGDQWLLLTLLALLLAVLARLIAASRWPSDYAAPVWWSAWLVSGWAMLGALAQFTVSWTLYLSGMLAVLIMVLFPLLRPLAVAAAVRGVSVALLSIPLVASLPGPEWLPYWGATLAMGWAYGLWLIGNLALPRWNARFPNWAMAPDAWPGLGLALLGLGLYRPGWETVLDWQSMLVLAAYLLLLLRNSDWPGFAWLGVVALTWAGVAVSITHNIESLSAIRPDTLTGVAVATLAWANLLLLAVPWWQRYGERIAAWLHWRFTGLQAPLLTGAFSLLAFWLLLLFAWDMLGLLFPRREATAVVVGGLLSLSLRHGCYRWRSPLVAQTLILALFGTLLAGWELLQPFSLPLFLALWGIAVTGATVLIPPGAGELSRWLGQSLAFWATFSPWLTLTALLLLPAVALPERLLTLVVLTAQSAWLGWQRQQRSWWLLAVVLLLALLHGVWLLWIPLQQFPAVLPWTALELAALVWMLYRLSGYRDRFRDNARLEPLFFILIKATPWAGALALMEWVWHGATVTLVLAVGLQPPSLADSWDSVAMLAGAALLIALGIDQARRTQNPLWVYGVALLALLAGIYLRLRWVGLAPPSVWDTAALMGAACGLFIVQRLTLSQPVLHLVMVLPLLALATVPWQLGSHQAAFTLMTAATLYLLTRRATGLETPLYLGLLALNGGVYLWVPEWAGQSGLFQLYLLPAIFTVLLLLQLHRHELKPGVLNGARLATLSALYATATLDVFLQERLGVFVLALILSLAGIVLGIGLRIRAFLYSGMAFLVLNVLGQLVKLYPEQRLGRALVLMALGVAIIGLMIWFNMKREAVLQRIRIFRADLARWE